MPIVSLNPKSFVKGGIGAQEGAWEIAKCRCVVHQFPANSQTGEQSAPTCMIQLELYKIDPNTLEHIDDEPVYEYLGWGRKNTLDNIRPGNKAKPEDTDAIDLGGALGTEGNTVYGDPVNGFKIYNVCAAARFLAALKDKGFKDEILDRGYLPDLEGTKFEAERVKTGFTPVNAQAGDRERTMLGVKKVYVFGYERKSRTTMLPPKTAAKKATPAAEGRPAAVPAVAAAATVTVAAAPPSPAPAAPPPQPAGNGSADGELSGELYSSIAIAGLEYIAKEFKGLEKKRVQVNAGVMTYLMRKTKLDAVSKKELLETTFKDDDWISAACLDKGIGFEPGVKAGEGTFLFPSE